MHWLEKTAALVRHNERLRDLAWLWDAVRPLYNRAIGVVGSAGLKRNMNGTDQMALSPRLRSFADTYEPEVWQALMGELQPGDTFVDVGTCFGIYAVAVGKRLGLAGRVIAFEPEGYNFSLAQENIALNHLRQTVELRRAAVSDKVGVVNFATGQGYVSHITEAAGPDTEAVECVTLDSALAGERVGVMKIDIEGHEEAALRGARNLLQDSQRRPRVMFIEVHPYAWGELGFTSESLLRLLAEYGYAVYELDGRPVTKIDAYGEVVARPVA